MTAPTRILGSVRRAVAVVAMGALCLPWGLLVSLRTPDDVSALEAFARLATIDAHELRHDAALLASIDALEQEWRLARDVSSVVEGTAGDRPVTLELRDRDVEACAHALLTLTEYRSLVGEELDSLDLLRRALETWLVARRGARDPRSVAWAVYALAGARHRGLDVDVDAVRAGLDMIPADRASRHALSAVAESVWGDLRLPRHGLHGVRTEVVDDEDFLWNGLWAATHRNDADESRGLWSSWREAAVRRGSPARDDRSQAVQDVIGALSRGRRLGPVIATWAPPDDGYGRRRWSTSHLMAPQQTRDLVGRPLGIGRGLEQASLSLWSLASWGQGSRFAPMYADLRDQLDDVYLALDEGASLRGIPFAIIALTELRDRDRAGWEYTDWMTRDIRAELDRRIAGCVERVDATLDEFDRSRELGWALLALALAEAEGATTSIDASTFAEHLADVEDDPTREVLAGVAACVWPEGDFPRAEPFPTDRRRAETYEQAFWIGSAAHLHSPRSAERWVERLVEGRPDHLRVVVTAGMSESDLIMQELVLGLARRANSLYLRVLRSDGGSWVRPRATGAFGR